jgi:hypothetical protein
VNPERNEIYNHVRYKNIDTNKYREELGKLFVGARQQSAAALPRRSLPARSRGVTSRNSRTSDAAASTWPFARTAVRIYIFVVSSAD